MPEFEPVMFGMLANVAVEVVPLYAALAVVHADMSGAHANACVPICYQLAGALEPACPQCGTRAGLVITHRLEDEHVDAVCPDDAHTWQLPNLLPKEFRDLVSKAQTRPHR